MSDASDRPEGAPAQPVCADTYCDLRWSGPHAHVPAVPAPVAAANDYICGHGGLRSKCPVEHNPQEDVDHDYAPVAEPQADATGIGATPATQIPEDLRDRYQFLYSVPVEIGLSLRERKEKELIERIATAESALRVVREERDRLEKRYAFDMCPECDFPHVRISNGPTEYVCAYCDLLEKCDAAETALLAERELRDRLVEIIREQDKTIMYEFRRYKAEREARKQAEGALRRARYFVAQSGKLGSSALLAKIDAALAPSETAGEPHE